MKDRVHRGFKVSHRKILEYDLPNDDNPLFAVWRQRACRRLHHFKDTELLS